MKSIREKFKLVLGMALLTGLLISSMALAQEPVTEAWVARYSTEPYFWTSALTVDSYGNVYVVGSYEVSGDYVTIKYGPDGNQLWVARYVPKGSCVHPRLYIAVDSQGNVYVASGTNCDLSGYSDYLTIKYDPAGNQLWESTYRDGGPNVNVIWGLAVDRQGNVYVSGYTGYGAAATTIKYDSNGNELWVAQHWGGAGFAMALDSQGNAYVAGHVGYDFLTIKYDTNGEEVWSRTYSAPNNSPVMAFAIAVDSNGNVYVGGNTIWTYPNPPDLMIVKYDNNGNELWVSRYEGAGFWWSQPPHPLAVDSQGDVYVAGLYTIKNSNPLGTPMMKYDSSGNLLWEAESNWTLALDSNRNVYVTTGAKTIKYDSNGNKVWEVPYDGVALDIAVDANENVYVVGLNSGNIVTVKYIQPYVQVQIDIKPGSYPNCFNQNERGVIPVAIFGSDALNVANIDIGSLWLQGLSVKVTGKSNKYLAHFEDINKDGYDDLIIQFQDNDGWVVPGSDYATLKGKLYNGTLIMGYDTICVTP